MDFIDISLLSFEVLIIYLLFSYSSGKFKFLLFTKIYLSSNIGSFCKAIFEDDKSTKELLLELDEIVADNKEFFWWISLIYGVLVREPGDFYLLESCLLTEPLLLKFELSLHNIIES